MNNAVKYGIGLLGLAVTVYVVGIAWKRSQKKNGSVAFASANGDKLRRIGAGVQTRTGAPLGKPQCFCGGIRQDCPC